jgi:hypothetical protein
LFERAKSAASSEKDKKVTGKIPTVLLRLRHIVTHH